MDINLNKFIKKKINNNLIKIALINKKFTRNKNKLGNVSIKKGKIINTNKSLHMNAGVYYCSKKLLKIIKNEKIFRGSNNS